MSFEPYLRELLFHRGQFPEFSRCPFALPAVIGLERLAFSTPVTFFIGENGYGKSTLLELIAVALGSKPEGGSRNFRFGTRSSYTELYRLLRAIRGVQRPRDGFFLRAESYFNVATEI